MLMAKDMPEDTKEYLQIIDQSAQRVAKIVKNLLIFARQRKPGRERVDLNSLISRVIELRIYNMKNHNIEVTTEFASDLPLTMADGGQLQQVFLNIILNAEQAMVTAHNKGNLLVKTEGRGGNIRISLKDDGPGIDSENLDKIFNPFFTTKSVGEGTGLGLSISYGIIKEHGGKLYAESTLGQGATFVVELPIVNEPQQPDLPQPSVEQAGRIAGARIMVVDDEPAICQLLKHALTKDGHNVETVDGASIALARLERERYDLILLDIQMVGMDGIELYKRMGEIAVSLQRRVVFITGDTMTPTTQNFLKEAKARCISKPFDVEQLKKDIRQILLREKAGLVSAAL
jgi:CheY-like chemotaxis protein